jgi:hypothetical protein
VRDGRRMTNTHVEKMSDTRGAVGIGIFEKKTVTNYPPHRLLPPRTNKRANPSAASCRRDSAFTRGKDHR